jgi:hypothetical protein
MFAFMLYGLWRFVMDYLGKPIRIAADYIDSMGAAFWLCLAVAGVLTLAMSVRSGRMR